MPTIKIKNSRSPDGRKEIVIVENEEFTGVASGTAKIREVKTGKILWSFYWSGFGEHPDAEIFKVLWRSDSRCFAINWQETRGGLTCAVYAESKKGWSQVELPDLTAKSLELARAAGESRVTIYENWGGKGHETVLAWLPGNRLRVETGYKGIMTPEMYGEWMQLFYFTLAIGTPSGKAAPSAIVKDAQLAPLPAYGN